MSTQFDADLDDLKTAVAAETDVNKSAVKLITGIPDMITTAVNAALAAGATPDQLQAVVDLANAVRSNAADLSTAMTSVSGNSSNQAPDPNNSPASPPADQNPQPTDQTPSTDQNPPPASP